MAIYMLEFMLENIQGWDQTMSVNYQKLYTYLVGQVDDVLQFIAGKLVLDGECDNSALLTVGSRLKNALLTAEDLHIDEMDEE